MNSKIAELRSKLFSPAPQQSSLLSSNQVTQSATQLIITSTSLAIKLSTSSPQLDLSVVVTQ